MKLMCPVYLSAVVAECRRRRIPVIFDEVFTGLYRLGGASAGALVGLDPDVSCLGKLMTGGAAPLAATLATERIFNAFKGDSKLQALLHGHSFTAYPMGCAAAAASIHFLGDPATNPHLEEKGGFMRPIWPADVVEKLSKSPAVAGVTALGTLLAVEMKVPELSHSNDKDGDTMRQKNKTSRGGGGYGSNAAVKVVEILKHQHKILARPLGHVAYVMVPPTSRRETAERLAIALEDAVERSQSEEGFGNVGEGPVV